MNKKFTAGIIIALILNVVVTLIAFSYLQNEIDQIKIEDIESTITEPNEPIESEPEPETEPSLVWSINLENFISDIVCDDGRVFVVDGVNVICFDKTNGKEIWRSKDIGGTTSKSMLVLYEDKVYAGTYGGVVTSFDKYTGKELLSRKRWEGVSFSVG